MPRPSKSKNRVRVSAPAPDLVLPSSSTVEQPTDNRQIKVRFLSRQPKFHPGLGKLGVSASFGKKRPQVQILQPGPINERAYSRRR